MFLMSFIYKYAYCRIFPMYLKTNKSSIIIEAFKRLLEESGRVVLSVYTYL